MSSNLRFPPFSDQWVVNSGVVILEEEVDLNAGDLIGLFYGAEGLTALLDLGGATVTPGIV
jgi:hypothetical protein